MIGLEQLSVSLGDFHLRDISLRIEQGEYFIVLGPTGAGKTVLLECIAGLMHPDEGRVLLAGADVTWTPPEQRAIGYLPQDYALFPNMSVRENIGFGLKIRKRGAEIPARSKELAEMLGIVHLLDREPGNLSGGEKQRVALGRALATDPDVMLLDEPLSALDVATRERIGDELRCVHEQAELTSVHICHNFDETIRLADRVALMRSGRIVQVGTPADIMRRPNSLFAAEFVQSENIFHGVAQCQGQHSRITIDGAELLCNTQIEGHVVATVRPDDVHVAGPDAPDDVDAVLIRGTVSHVEDRGHGFAIRTQGSLQLTALVSRPRMQRLNIRKGEHVFLGVSPATVHVFESPGEATSGPGASA